MVGKDKATICGVQHLLELGAACLMTALLLLLCEAVAANECPPKCGVLSRIIQCHHHQIGRPPIKDDLCGVVAGETSSTKLSMTFNVSSPVVVHMVGFLVHF